jgi:molybdate transport system substrate-binding protein
VQRRMRGRARRHLPLAVAVAVVTVLPSTVVSRASASVPAKARLSGSITVSAAASLTEAFTTIGRGFERKHPGTTVTFNFGSSSTLVTQIQGGAPADVLASADLTSMDRLAAAGRVAASPAIFARNQLEIAVKPGNPKGVETLADLEGVGIIALCGATVPCGAYAAKVLARAGVSIPASRITRGGDAKATLAAVSQGDADAALVYVTDVRGARKMVHGVTIPDDENMVASYPIAPLASSSNAKLAKAFVAHVTSRAAEKSLARYGFLAP